MKTGLRITALLVAVLAAGLWFFGGMNTGWTKTKVGVPSKDPVTGIDFVQWENHFLPGLDFLAGGLAATVVLIGASFVAGRGRK